MGTMIDRVQRTLTDADIATIADTYHSWRGDRSAAKPGEAVGRGDKENGAAGKTYADIAGFCKAATLDEIRTHGHVLTPGRYVGAEEAIDDGVSFEDKMAALTAELAQLTAQGAGLDRAIAANLAAIGFPTLTTKTGM